VLCHFAGKDACAAVKRTWGADCDKLVFVADFEDSDLGAVDVHAEADGTIDCMINKVAKGFEWAMAHHSDYDWYVKLDADSFFLADNFRHYVLSEFPLIANAVQEPRYIGRRLKRDGNPDFVFNAGAGYALNREAAQVLLCAYANQRTCSIGSSAVKTRQLDLAVDLLQDWDAGGASADKPCLKNHNGGDDCLCNAKKLGNHEDVMTSVCLMLFNVLPYVNLRSSHVPNFTNQLTLPPGVLCRYDTRDFIGADRFHNYLPASVVYQMAPDSSYHYQRPHNQATTTQEPNLMFPADPDEWYYLYSFVVSDSHDWRRRVSQHPVVFHRYLERHYSAVPSLRKRLAERSKDGPQ
jgi:hypothetical protein